MMRTRFCLLILAVALVGAPLLCKADDEDPNQSMPGVVDLTPDNFDKFVDGKKAAFIEFYAPWCGHCKHLAPAWKKLGEKIASDPVLSSRVVVGKVDADAHSELSNRFNVRGFPTIKWFARGRPDKPKNYDGGREFHELVAFIEKKLKSDAGFARIAALNPIARKFHLAEAADKKSIAAELSAEAAKVSEEERGNADLYIKYANKALEKGDAYITGELARLDKMAQSGSMSTVKLEEISRKVSVLSSFTEDDAGVANDDDVSDDEPADPYGDDLGDDEAMPGPDFDFGALYGDDEY